MKRALIAAASVGILAVTVGVETANAQSYRRYGPTRTYISQAYTPQSRGSVRREAFCALSRFPTRTVRRPQAVVALATIEPSRAFEKKDGHACAWLGLTGGGKAGVRRRKGGDHE